MSPPEASAATREKARHQKSSSGSSMTVNLPDGRLYTSAIDGEGGADKGVTGNRLRHRHRLATRAVSRCGWRVSLVERTPHGVEEPVNIGTYMLRPATRVLTAWRPTMGRAKRKLLGRRKGRGVADGVSRCLRARRRQMSANVAYR